MSANSKQILIYAISGSQFVAKVLAALENRGIAHFVELVPLGTKARAKALPVKDGSTKTPVMKVGEGDDAIVVQDSEKILEWLDQNMDAKLYPNELASTVSKRASDGKLAASVWYFNWVDNEGYKNSMRRTFAEGLLPGFLQFMSPGLDLLLKGTRKQFKELCKEPFGAENVGDRAKVEAMTIEELKYFQSLLEKPHDEQPYLIPGTTQPTAPDFSVYAQTGRLFGHGDASDVKIYAARPDLMEKPDLKRFVEWHENMVKTCPIHFKGKRLKADSKV